MRKLLHLAFAVWKSGKPFDPQHYPWETGTGQKKEAAGHNQEASPDQQVVTATSTETLSPPTSDVNTLSSGVDFQSVRSQTSMQQVLELLEFDPDRNARRSATRRLSSSRLDLAKQSFLLCEPFQEHVPLF